MWERIERHWFDHFASRSGSAHLAIVSHGLFLRSLLERRLLSAEQLERHGDGEGRITIDNTALSIVTLHHANASPEPHRVDLIACTAHLEAEPESQDEPLAPV